MLSVRLFLDDIVELRFGNFTALDQLCRFRSTHLEYARSYIVKQSRGDARNPNAIGTGGTPFVPYLTKHRNETKSYRIV